MKTSTSFSHLFRTSIVVAMTCFALTGCMSSTSVSGDYQSDGASSFMNQETINMGQMFTAQGSAKETADTDTVTGEIVIHRLHYNDTCKCFVRDAQFTFTNASGKTFTRERQDSIWLTDSLGNYMTTFHPFQAVTIKHDRHVVKVNGAVDIEVQNNATLTWIFDNGVRTGAEWSGTITGTFNGAEFKNGSFKKVKRPFIFLGSFVVGFGFPSDGVIHMERGDFSLDITFKGAGMAEVIVIGKGKIHHIKCNGGDETQED